MNSVVRKFFCMVFWNNISDNSPGKLYAVMLYDDPRRSDPEAVGSRNDTVPDLLAVGFALRYYKPLVQ